MVLAGTACAAELGPAATTDANFIRRLSQVAVLVHGYASTLNQASVISRERITHLRGVTKPKRRVVSIKYLRL